MDFLFLSQKDMLRAGVLDMHKCVKVMDKAFKLLGKGDYIMGGPSGNSHGIKLWFPYKPRGPNMPVDAPDRRFLSLIAYLGGEFNICGQKWYGSNIENPLKYSLPRSVLLITLNDPVTAVPLAIMEGNLVSAMRTGAVVGLGAKYLAKRNAEVAGIIAAGVISRTCLMALSVGLKNLKEVKVFDVSQSKAQIFSAEMSKELSINVHPVDTLEEAVRNSDAISFATSGAKKPFIKTEWLKEGSFITLSSEAEFSDDLWRTSKIVADNWKMHLDWREDFKRLPGGFKSRIMYSSIHELIGKGELKDEDILELGQITSDARKVKKNKQERIVFITGGMAIEDLAWSYTIYKRALEENIGQKLTLWDEPYWL
ncbi:MAG TPA: ornithine cyclodeaminase [Deltaproteobacteria bacterium]|nr:ornithine cyclodeaminase [Deltaproteobacteria bacterium]